MHWLIPAVSHSLSSLLAWRGGTVTLAAVLLSFPLAATQSIHLWAIYYGLFALLFLAAASSAAISRLRSTAQDGQIKPWNATAAFFLANLLVAAALVPLHQYYLKQRLALVPWFHIFRAPAGCLPIPSRTYTEPFKYTFVDALANQLPYGVVVSYAAAMACLFSFHVGPKPVAGGLSIQGILAAALGALAVSLTAAYGLPMCGDDLENGTHQVAVSGAQTARHTTRMHVDRSVEWKERTQLTWSPEARYGRFVVLITLAGTTGAVIAAHLAQAFRKSNVRGASANPSTTPDLKAASKSQEREEKAPSEKAAGTQSKTNSAPASVEEKSGAPSYHAASLCMNVLVTTTVVLGMAIWSWTGPWAEREDHLGIPI